MNFWFGEVDRTNGSEQLRKDGNLRDDVYIPPDTAPQSWEDIRKKVQEALDPNKEQEFKEAEKQVRDGSSSS